MDERTLSGEYIVDVGSNPTIGDVVTTKGEIVRCRDCKFCMAYMAGTYCDYMAHSVEPDGFCAWAERKEVTR